MLVIERESKGDNQVLSTYYKTPEIKTEDKLLTSLNNMVINNNEIMKAIEEGTQKLELIINKDETIVSAEMLVYGKNLIHGNLIGLDCKRFSRISCVTNDQIPSLANVMSTVSSNILTVSQMSHSPIEPMRQHNFFGNFIRNIIELHDPVLQSSIPSLMIDDFKYDSKIYKLLALYLDPSLGRVCETSLSRFLIRTFPDPITEGSSFWKLIHNNAKT